MKSLIQNSLRGTSKLMLTLLACTSLILTAAGCGSQTADLPASEGKSGSPEAAEAVKIKPDQLTTIKMGLPSKNMSYLPIYVAQKKGFYKNVNLEVNLEYVKGGVLALRGLQTGEYPIISTLPESVITGVAEGANVKMIGTLDDKSMYSIFVSKDIKSPSDLKGKSAASNVPGNGTDIQLQYWLKKNGLVPNEDVRLINAGENAGRLQALQTGQASVTILSQPTDLKAEELGFTRLSLMRDELKTYNHNMIAVNGDVVKNTPEVVYAFMSAHAEAVKFIKDSANREEALQIAMSELGMKKADAEKSFDFVLPALADKGKMNIEGMKWAIDTVKETGALSKEISVDKVVDERFYAK
ncbi:MULTISPECIES: ABC transporter substrate-binding protein [unclassified Paenibacillus]|uniref:ABC transporter substrate-binding protein n=1 Tax=unclassified Paenibacillus TaxID=185978 RepID=UPI001AE60E91|nr:MULTISPECIES: ABC transporter substrate-binding protein [unclassified Paenibacillus]MBP1155823.1 ABC-type nitrate/sulfonate/bicarbonate transport system substrate-binding protein [Paenibacillus sp. PvP091]MBP1168791.1 ABC-type nitrate/sulfonate/bicarbonate transport system substrate-binding protein [Paenibacillus sp. PvR098]MBP2439819.1 ABC-type nitrate/sulfonate/bicarbonate transport system substrate-binding protein [Paenibacillus sp. PvP052]